MQLGRLVHGFPSVLVYTKEILVPNITVNKTVFVVLYTPVC